MKKVLSTLLLIEVVASLFFIWQMQLLRGWQMANPAVFHNSPDATYLYSSVLQAASHGRGFLLGLWIGVVGIIFARKHFMQVSSEHIPRGLVAVVLILPLLALVVGSIVGRLS
jgi:hypothetical protein